MRYHFDHNAGAPVDRRVLERFLTVERDHPGNPGSLHQLGRKSRAVVESARDRLGELFAVDPEHVFFVSGGTEANNIAVFGSGDRSLPVLCADVEHPSVLAAAEQRGVVRWSVDGRGLARITAPGQAVGMLALVHGQNEVGSLQPIESARALATQLAVPLHIDAAQTLGRVPVENAVQWADSVTFSGHKVGGLRGMGVLIDKRPDTVPRFFGGGQQRGRRPGTEAPGLVAATAYALELAVVETAQRTTAMRAARDAFVAALDLECVRCLTPSASLPNTAMLHFAGVEGRALLPALDIAGVEASQGSACSSGSPTPPRVLLAMGLDEVAARACVRFSFDANTTTDEAVAGASLVKRVLLGMNAR